MSTPAGPPPGPYGAGAPASGATPRSPSGTAVASAPAAEATAPRREGPRRWWPVAALVAAALLAGGVVGGVLVGGDGPRSEVGRSAPVPPVAPGGLDLDVRVTYCSPGDISSWAQGMAVNHGAAAVNARITVTFGRDGAADLGDARADVVELGPGQAVNWRAADGPPGEFDHCAVTSVEPA
jgi:hypothetical protein